MLKLKNVTLLGIDGGGNSYDTLKAINYSSKNVEFARKIFLTSAPEKYETNSCELIKIKKLEYDELNKFSLVEMYKYIDTEYVLGVHPDGFILNPHLWQNNFLNYDIIGAPWPLQLIINFCSHNHILRNSMINNVEIFQVGNGGFCLKSKKLLELTSKMYKEEYANLADDVLIGVVMRKELEKYGIKFPNFITAGQFSCENKLVNGIMFDPKTSFGFHGKVYHPELLKLLD